MGPRGEVLFGAIQAAGSTPPGVLPEIAREFSPRIEVWSRTEVVLDLSGLMRLFGEARTIAEEVRRTAADRGVRVRVAMAGTRTAARLLVRHRAGLTIVTPGTEAAALAPLPIALLGDLSGLGARDSGSGNREPGTREPGTREPGTSNSRIPDPRSRIPDLISTFRRWGLRTMGEIASLPSDEVAARLGSGGTEWQRLARGEDPRPLVPAVPEERFEQTLELEWPIESLEPLSFVLGRLMEPLAAHLEHRDRGAAVLHVRLHLVRTAGAAREVYERSLQLPIPIRDPRTLRTLAMLDLESNPPAAPIDRVTVAVDPTPGRIVQFSLLTRPLPSPEQISTLMARLHALMGETRCGSPTTVDSWQPGAYAMKPFASLDVEAIHMRHDTPRHRDTEGKTSRPVMRNLGASVPRCVVLGEGASSPTVALRRFRHPVPIRVHVEGGKPSSVSIVQRGLRGGKVESCAGPWRTSGGWWGSIQDPGLGAWDLESGDEGSGNGAQGPKAQSREPGAESRMSWDRDEWDVALADGPVCRLFRERATDRWFLEGVID